MDIQAADKTLRNLGTFNLLLGKNGSGKSTILRNLDNALTGKGKVVYLAPERGGTLYYDGYVETLRQKDDFGNRSERRQNQVMDFRQASVSEFKKLDLFEIDGYYKIGEWGRNSEWVDFESEHMGIEGCEVLAEKLLKKSTKKLGYMK